MSDPAYTVDGVRHAVTSLIGRKVKNFMSRPGRQFLEVQPGRLAGRPSSGVKNGKPAISLRLCLVKPNSLKLIVPSGCTTNMAGTLCRPKAAETGYGCSSINTSNVSPYS